MTTTDGGVRIYKLEGGGYLLVERGAAAVTAYELPLPVGGDADAGVARAGALAQALLSAKAEVLRLAAGRAGAEGNRAEDLEDAREKAAALEHALREWETRTKEARRILEDASSGEASSDVVEMARMVARQLRESRAAHGAFKDMVVNRLLAAGATGKSAVEMLDQFISTFSETVDALEVATESSPRCRAAVAWLLWCGGTGGDHWLSPLRSKFGDEVADEVREWFRARAVDVDALGRLRSSELERLVREGKETEDGDDDQAGVPGTRAQPAGDREGGEGGGGPLPGADGPRGARAERGGAGDGDRQDEARGGVLLREAGGREQPGEPARGGSGAPGGDAPDSLRARATARAALRALELSRKLGFVAPELVPERIRDAIVAEQDAVRRETQDVLSSPAVPAAYRCEKCGRTSADYVGECPGCGHNSHTFPHRDGELRAALRDIQGYLSGARGPAGVADPGEVTRLAREVGKEVFRLRADARDLRALAEREGAAVTRHVARVRELISVLRGRPWADSDAENVVELARAVKAERDGLRETVEKMKRVIVEGGWSS